MHIKGHKDSLQFLCLFTNLCIKRLIFVYFYQKTVVINLCQGLFSHSGYPKYLDINGMLYYNFQ